MDEAEIQRRARAFVAKLDVSGVRADLAVYVAAANAKVRSEQLNAGESGFTVTKAGMHVITTNSVEAEVRQRFTICHEIAHIVLGLPSNHEVPAWRFAKRDPKEVACDVFAAELLMPHKMWRASVPSGEPSREVVIALAGEYGVSIPAAASRYAALADIPCAFVTMEGGTVRYAARSGPLRRAGAKIRASTPVPAGSVAHRLRARAANGDETGTVAQDVWFDDWDNGYDLTELAWHIGRFDTTLSLLWCDHEEAPEREEDRFGRAVVEDELLPELTGELPWPGKRKRR
jgi:Zn-dependent peptidase ImmA (M78 family)